MLYFQMIDFGVCRPGGCYEHFVFIVNHGVVGYKIQVDVDPYDPILKVFRKDKSAEFKKNLRSIGFQIQYKPYVPAQGKSVLKVKFQPPSEMDHITFQLRIRQHSSDNTLTVMGSSALPVLELLPQFGGDDQKGQEEENVAVKDDHLTLDFKICPLNKTLTKHLLLVNKGVLPTDFYIQRGLPSEITIEPFSGVVLPGEEKVIAVSFCPKTSGKVNSKIKILHNAANPVELIVKGQGGAAFLQAEFLSKHDALIKGLDFELVPTRAKTYRYFVLYNRGIVHSNLKIRTNSPHYTVEVTGKPILAQSLTAAALQSLKNATSLNLLEVISLWKSLGKSSNTNDKESLPLPMMPPYQAEMMSGKGHHIVLPPDQCTLCSVVLVAAKPKIYSGILQVESDFNSLQLVLKGRGGTINMKHQGTLSFKRVACNRLFTKKITIENGGSIPVRVRLYWQLAVRMPCFDFTIFTIFIPANSLLLMLRESTLV
jgi:hypothetical protein